MAVYTITLNDTNKSWKELKYNRKLVLNAPTEFSATIEYDIDNPVNFMDVVRIYRDGIIKWKGYIEKINPKWTSEGQYLYISGRDTLLILWKKYSDDFTNFAQKTAGFFGTIDPTQLLNFILHTPKSEIGIDYPYNKEGWGLDFTNTIDVERSDVYYANSNDIKLSEGSPKWAFARQRGYGWFSTGRKTLEPDSKTTSSVSSYESPWTLVGSSPYVNGAPRAPTYSNYVSSIGVNIQKGKNIIFNIAGFNMTGFTLEGGANLTITYLSGTRIFYPYGTAYGTFNVYIYITSQDLWIKVGSNIGDVSGTIKTIALDIASYITNPNDITSGFQVKIETSDAIWLNQGVQIGAIQLNIIKSSPNAHQTIGDNFEIVFKPELLIPSGKIHPSNTNGLIGEYLLNEGVGTTIIDSSGTNPNASAHNIQWQTPSYVPQPVAYFNGAGCYISCGNNFTWVTGHNSLSIDCWTDLTLINYLTQNYIVSKPNQILLKVDQTGTLVFSLYMNGSGWKTISSIEPIVQGQRAHIQAIYDGFSMNLYVNCSLVGSVSETGYLSTEGGQSSTLQFGPLHGYLSSILIYNRATYPIITALYFECRTDPTTYPRGYTLEYIHNGSYTVIPNTLPSMPQSVNTNRDNIISFTPISTQKIRIKLTANDSNNTWGVSQIYVYKAENTKYKLYLDTGESDPSTDPTTIPYIYTGGPYVKSFNNLSNSSPRPIGPLNISRQRLLDAVNYIVGLCSSIEVEENNTIGFQPMEWWLSADDDNSFNIREQKGDDKSSAIIFQSGINLGSCDFQSWIDDSVQNIYMVGQGEQKKLEDTSLWIKSKDASGSATNGLPLIDAEKYVRTFFEDIAQDKSIIINDSDYPAIGNILGSANLTINAMPRVQLMISLTKDNYVSFDCSSNSNQPNSYDVGDTISIVDSINGIGVESNKNPYDLTNGIYRIQNIDVSVSEGIGEDIQITLGYPNYKFQDELQTMYRNIKSMGAVGTFNSDWSAEGTDKKLLDARLISAQSQYSVNAQNDKIAQSIAYDGNNWATIDNNISESAATNTISSRFLWGTNYFGIQSSQDNDIHRLQVALIGNLVQYYDGSNVIDGGDAADINMYWNPHMSMDFKICDGVFVDIAQAQWQYDHWTSGEYTRIGLATTDGTYGFWFMFIRNNVTSDPALFDVYVQWSLPNGSTNFSIDDCMNYPTGTNLGSYLKTIVANQRYKIEILTQSDPKFIATQTPNVQFNLFEYKSMMTTNSQGLNLTYVQLTYPTIGICVDNQIYNMVVKPLYCELYNKAHGNSLAPNMMYFYNFVTDWKVLQISAQ